MALVRFINGKETSLTPEKGAEMWRVLNNEVDPTEEQERFCLKVSRLFLNWRNAPVSYVRDREVTLRDMYKGTKEIALINEILNRRD